MRSQTIARDANIERLRFLLRDLVDANGRLRGWSLHRIATAFNERYGGETKPITGTTIGLYIQKAVAAAWLVSERENTIIKRLVLTLVAPETSTEETE